MAIPMPWAHLGPRPRRVLKWVGYAALAVVTFVFALQLTFPYERVRDRIVEALSSKYDVTIAGVERGLLPGRVYFSNVTLRTRAEKPDDVVNTLFVQRLQVDLGLFALIGQTASVDLDATVGAGHLAGNISLSKSGTSVNLVGSNLPSQSLPMREVIGLPMSGLLQLSISLDLPTEKSKAGRTVQSWSKAAGAIQFSCASCVFGDGKTKIKPKLKNSRSQAFAGDGIEFGKVNVTTLLARVEIGDGKLALKKFEMKSPDGEVHVTYEMGLVDSFADSTVTGCLRFKGTPELQNREPKTFAALSTTGAPAAADGLFNIKLDGKFKDMKRLGVLCGPGVSDKADDGGKDGRDGPSRPNLTVQPDPTKPATPTPGSMPPPPPPIGSGSAAAGNSGPPPGDPNASTPAPPAPGEARGSAGSAGSNTGSGNAGGGGDDHGNTGHANDGHGSAPNSPGSGSGQADAPMPYDGN